MKNKINTMREGSHILSQIMEKLKKEVQPGIKTKDLERVSKDLVFDYKVEPAFLNYNGFPAILCVSVNSVVVHGVPSDYILKEGDITSLSF